MAAAALRLIKPVARLEQSHAGLIAEFVERDEELVPWVLEEVGEDFGAYVDWLDNNARGENLQPGFVPNTTLWLIDDADEILGVANMRHVLTDSLIEYGGHIGYGVRPSARRRGCATEMLRQSLIVLRSLGVGDVRVTCDRHNVASAKTIIRNGGELDSEAYMAEHQCHVQRYWIRQHAT